MSQFPQRTSTISIGFVLRVMHRQKGISGVPRTDNSPALVMTHGPANSGICKKLALEWVGSLSQLQRMRAREREPCLQVCWLVLHQVVMLRAISNLAVHACWTWQHIFTSLRESFGPNKFLSRWRDSRAPSHSSSLFSFIVVPCSSSSSPFIRTLVSLLSCLLALMHMW